MNKSIGNAVKLVIFVISLSLVSSSFAGPARPLMLGDLTDSDKASSSSAAPSDSMEKDSGAEQTTKQYKYIHKHDWIADSNTLILSSLILAGGFFGYMSGYYTFQTFSPELVEALKTSDNNLKEYLLVGTVSVGHQLGGLAAGAGSVMAGYKCREIFKNRKIKVQAIERGKSAGLYL